MLAQKAAWPFAQIAKSPKIDCLLVYRFKVNGLRSPSMPIFTDLLRFADNDINFGFSKKKPGSTIWLVISSMVALGAAMLACSCNLSNVRLVPHLVLQIHH